MRALTLFNHRRPQSVQDLMEEFLKDFDRNLLDRPFAQLEGVGFSPSVDIEEKEGILHFTVDLPGLKKEDIKLDLHENTFTISGERMKEIKGDKKFFERSWGKFSRSFTLPYPVDEEKIQARFEDGVLHVTLPGREVRKARAIQIS